ncbi:MAG: adenine phosphoribosyltransferase [Planctomycetia bacterium]|nr:adenine phosphoribosyltransferase [Planctomycetia bacterium]
MDLNPFIRPVPDFPKPGILFRDITPLLADPQALAVAVERMGEPWRHAKLDLIAAVEARGFLFATPLALALGIGVIPVRKPGKLPAATISHSYKLAGSRVLVVDDVLATGGTAEACMRLIEAGGGTVVGAAFLLELEQLGGRERLAPHRVECVLSY